MCKVCIVLEEKGPPYELESPVPGLHPMGKMPVLRDGEVVIPDSSVIAAYRKLRDPVVESGRIVFSARPRPTSRSLPALRRRRGAAMAAPAQAPAAGAPVARIRLHGMARLRGQVKANDVLTPAQLAEGRVLSCQFVPAGRGGIDYPGRASAPPRVGPRGPVGWRRGDLI